MNIEYAIVGKTTNPNELGLEELDVIFTDFEKAKERLNEIESSTPNANGKFKIVCRQVTDWCEVLMK